MLVLQAMGKYDEEAKLYPRIIAIQEKTLGPDHPSLATTLNNLAVLLEEGKVSFSTFD